MDLLLISALPFLGAIAIGLAARAPRKVHAVIAGLFTLAALGMAWREYRAWARFAKIDAIHARARDPSCRL